MRTSNQDPDLTTKQSPIRAKINLDGGAVIKRRATKLEQNNKMPLFQFALTSEEVLAVADISRLSRDDAGKLLGYQRPIVKKHVQDITEYLNSDAPLFPHPIIIAFSSRVSFVNSRGPGVDDGVSSAGTISIPVPASGEVKPGWIVDGQQRALALSRAKRQDFPVPVCAFITDDVAVQREQFVRINNSHPLRQGIISELLAEVSVPISARTSPRKLPSELINLLAFREKSPFLGLIRRESLAAESKQRAVITDTALEKVLRENLGSSGCLFPYRNVATGEADVDRIWNILITYWTAVQNTFPEAWGKPPTESRLMHSAGLLAMGKLMDRIMGRLSGAEGLSVARVEKELQLIIPICRWTHGKWESLGGIPWNELQNVPRHVSALSNLLVRAYIELTTRTE
jgi:DGQHR domain-containing protein